jgi:hypothetical protein
MENERQQQAPNDEIISEIVKKRASFKTHLTTYVVINGFLWVLWFFQTRGNSSNNYPWPIWTTMGWGIGLVFHYLAACVYPREYLVEKEYEKLKWEQNK